MNPAEMDLLLSKKTPDELLDGLDVIGKMQRFGALSEAEAKEWRERILARVKSHHAARQPPRCVE